MFGKSKIKNDVEYAAVLAERVRLYPAVAVAARRLRAITAWDPNNLLGHEQAGFDLDPAAEALRGAALAAGFFGGAQVVEPTADLVRAGEEYVAELTRIRTTTRRGQAGAVDAREQESHDAVAARFDGAIERYSEVARAELGILGPRP
jgi:hypothetical protein